MEHCLRGTWPTSPKVNVSAVSRTVRRSFLTLPPSPILHLTFVSNPAATGSVKPPCGFHSRGSCSGLLAHGYWALFFEVSCLSHETMNISWEK